MLDLLCSLKCLVPLGVAGFLWLLALAFLEWHIYHAPEEDEPGQYG